MLAGAVTLFVGLVQLKPGAEASQYRYVLIGSGLLCTLLGTILAVIRCCLLPWVARRRQQQRENRRKQHRHHHQPEEFLSPTITNTSVNDGSVGCQPQQPPSKAAALSDPIGSSV